MAKTNGSAEGGRPGEVGVLRAILQREAAGLPLNHTAVLRDDRRLHADILRVFGGWDAAMRAAGIDPARVRPHRRWGRQAVISRITELAAQGKPLNLRAIQTSEAVLASAADRYFASWADALLAAGVDPDKWRRRVPNWTRDRVIAGIHEIRSTGGKLNHTALRRNSLSHAGVRLFGCWDAALRAAGLDPDEVRIARKPWTRESMVKEIQHKHLAGEPLNARDVSPNWIRKSARRLFGSWDAALAAAGLNPTEIRGNRQRG